MTEQPVTDPVTAALSHATSDSLNAAIRARQVLHRNTLDYVARLIRDALPEAAAITVDTDDGELYEVRDAHGKALYRAPFTPASPLTDSYADDIEDLFRQAFAFGPGGLVAAGWEVAAEGEPYRSILLPTSDVTRRCTAATAFPTSEGMATIQAEYTPGARPAFHITGPNSTHARDTADRVRAGLVNAGLEWKPGLMHIDVPWAVARTGSSADLAIACTAAATAGYIDPAALNKVVLLGELGLDGKVRPVGDVATAVRIAQRAGYVKFIVAVDDFDEVSKNEIITPVGVQDLNAALSFLEEMHQTPPTTTAADAPRRGTPGEDAGQCAQCDRPLVWDSTGKRVNDTWGEYLCYAPRRKGGKAVHVLAD